MLVANVHNVPAVGQLAGTRDTAVLGDDIATAPAWVLRWSVWDTGHVLPTATSYRA